jgi:aconitate hydratase
MTDKCKLAIVENTNAQPTTLLEVGGTAYRRIDLHAAAGLRLPAMPVVLRLLLENVLRHQRGAERDAACAALLAWAPAGSSEAEVPFQPGRVLMHDTTSTPALVDIAAMRDALAEAGVDPARLNPTLPVDVSVDHSLAVEAYARTDAPALNLQHELRRNRERYGFLRWASSALQGVRIHPPGTGIMHTINLEQLATVVTSETRDGQAWAVPDMMLGTDSHTPMVNGLGVLGWGVGGLEAQTVMFGMPTVLRIPDVIGVQLTGCLGAGVLATDLALVVTQRLRAIGVSGEFVEFFGPGVAALSAGERCVVANMAPEYGASTGYFPIDAATLTYLRETGRDEARIALVEAYARAAGIWFDPHATPRYTRVVEIDLAAIGQHVAGPRRPQDLLEVHETREALARIGFEPRTSHGTLPRHAIAIAAITSCTNTSDPRLLVAAGLVARKARVLGLRVPNWVKTSLAPGSPAAASYLERAGLSEDLATVGFQIVGHGCTTCIGNSGPLPGVIRDAMAAGQVHPVAVLSGNRNFAGRVHPDLDLGFLMSPPLVVVFALAGDAERNLRDEPVQVLPNGRPVRLADLWPHQDEIEACLAQGLRADDFARDFARASAHPAWQALQSPAGARYPWDPRSTILRRPPFASAAAGSQLGRYTAHPLLVVGDDVTTDHISPASAIPRDSEVADFLVAQGDDRDDLNVFASRRGNWQAMQRAAFHSKTLVNRLLHRSSGAPVASTLHAPSGALLPIWQAAERYAAAGEPVVIVAGERYGTGSSRDWAAKGPRLLGVRAVLALSFERIHRSNLIGMGILPLRLPPGAGPDALGLVSGDRIEIDAATEGLAPRGPVPVRVLRADGSAQTLATTAAVETEFELALLRAGGVIPSILQRCLAGTA